MSIDRPDLRKVWRDYIRELMKDRDYEIRKAQFLAQKKEREPMGSEPLREGDKVETCLLNFTKLEDENDRN